MGEKSLETSQVFLCLLLSFFYSSFGLAFDCLFDHCRQFLYVRNRVRFGLPAYTECRLSWLETGESFAGPRWPFENHRFRIRQETNRQVKLPANCISNHRQSANSCWSCFTWLTTVETCNFSSNHEQQRHFVTRDLVVVVGVVAVVVVVRGMVVAARQNKPKGFVQRPEQMVTRVASNGCWKECFYGAVVLCTM